VHLHGRSDVLSLRTLVTSAFWRPNHLPAGDPSGL